VSASYHDQTTDLVDTNSFASARLRGRRSGWLVLRSTSMRDFDGRTPRRSGASGVIIAEPVGSCPDLSRRSCDRWCKSTRQPLDVAPYGVIIKPSHGAKILRTKPGRILSEGGVHLSQADRRGGLSSSSTGSTRCRRTPGERSRDALKGTIPGRPILRMSAKSGEGFAAFCEFLEQRGDFGSA